MFLIVVIPAYVVLIVPFFVVIPIISFLKIFFVKAFAAPDFSSAGATAFALMRTLVLPLLSSSSVVSMSSFAILSSFAPFFAIIILQQFAAVECE